MKTLKVYRNKKSTDKIILRHQSCIKKNSYGARNSI